MSRRMMRLGSPQTRRCHFCGSQASGPLNNCTSSYFLVEKQTAAEQWSVASGCESVRRSDDSLHCYLTYLSCDMTYRFRVQEVCTDSNANSDFSFASEWATTTKKESCIVAAAAAVSVSMSDPLTTSMVVTWIPAEIQRDCAFLVWRVEARPVNADSWSLVSGCSELRDTAVTNCTVSGLRPNTPHNFRAREECVYSRATSEWRQSEASWSPLVLAAAPPSGVSVEVDTLSSMRVQWEVPVMNNCTFQRYDVELRNLSGDFNPAVMC